MRTIVIIGALCMLAACEDEDVPTVQTPPVATARRPRTQKQIDDCRDACEQSQIVTGQADDSALRACRLGCTTGGAGGIGGAGGAHEVPRSISHAPSLSAPPPVRPVGANR
ncbi:MAG TPA: hypothetical protein VHB97_25245 [Polyangia bacterium]|jgi:hypothetical protein|nr:hypothetical protein [Polyangia bacterium]